MNLRLDDTHTYWLGEKKVPGVNEIIQDLGISNSDFYTEEHAQRGRDIHKLCDVCDGLGANIDHKYSGYRDGWNKFKEDYNFKPKKIELMLYHPILMYAGTIDRVGSMDKKSVLIDIKSGQPQKWHELQLTGYHALLESQKPSILPQLICAVYLRENGTYKMVEVETDPYLWHSCLRVYNYKHG